MSGGAGVPRSASITATLAHRGLHQGAVATLNLLVMLAVLLTYPLQFLPSVQILEKAAQLDGASLSEARWRGVVKSRAPTGYARPSTSHTDPRSTLCS